jgi:hypothetical protein
MVLLYILTAAVIAWGLYKDLSRRETWRIAFGKVVRRDKPRVYWLTIGLRCLILLTVIFAAYLRSRV